MIRIPKKYKFQKKLKFSLIPRTESLVEFERNSQNLYSPIQRLKWLRFENFRKMIMQKTFQVFIDNFPSKIFRMKKNFTTASKVSKVNWWLNIFKKMQSPEPRFPAGSKKFPNVLMFKLTNQKSKNSTFLRIIPSLKTGFR